MSHAELESPHTYVLESAEEFAAWLATMATAGGVSGAGASEHDPTSGPPDAAALDGAAAALVLDPATAAALVRWRDDKPLAAAPVDQPTGIHDLTPRLFAPYHVQGGQVHLAGCVLDDAPFVRLSYFDQPSRAVRHYYFQPSGEAASAELLDRLNLTRLGPAGRPVRARDDELAAAIEQARQRLERDGPESPAQFLLAVVAATRRAVGKLEFVIGEQSAAVPFDAWASDLATGRQAPPPFVCAASGKSSYSIVADDDGRLTVAEALGRCEETGRRLIESELAICQATGRRVERALLHSCPVSGERVLARELTACGMCQQNVSPTVLEGGACRACRRLAAVRKDDPRMARVLGEHPRLDRWGAWRLSETSTVYILSASGWLQRLLVVLHKESLEPLRVAMQGRLGGAWVDVPENQRGELLG